MTDDHVPSDDGAQPIGRPHILPEVFNGEEDFGEWIHHFESVAVVNKWDDSTKLQWLHVRVAGKARVALSRAKSESYKQAREALQKRFEPSSKSELYKNELQHVAKRESENWGDFADRLAVLTDKAYPELQEEAREYIALNHYIDQLEDPRIAFSVRQRRPKTMAEAVSSTLELESYLIGAATQEPKESTIASTQTDLGAMLNKLMEKLKKLEYDLNERQEINKRSRQYHRQRQRKRKHQEVICRKCKQPGHFAIGYAKDAPRALPSPQTEGEVSLPMSQVCDSSCSSPDNATCTIAINSVSNYTVCARLFSKEVSFLVDTGAAVSLVSSEVWDRIKPSSAPRMNPVGLRLVGVDGAPLHIRGSVIVELEISAKTFKQEVIIVDALTSEGILGLNFLEANNCVLDLGRGELCSGQTRIPLSAKELQMNSIRHVEVLIPETLTIAAMSEIEIMGRVPQNCEGAWMVEDKPVKKHHVIIARAIVVPKDGKVPLRIINLECEPTTIYKGTKVASAEAISMIEEILSVDKTDDGECTDQEWKKVIDDVLNTMPDTFSDHQLTLFSALLSSYAHIFAYKHGDLGRTDVLNHRIETSGSPIRQPVRRVPLPQRDEIKRLLTEMQEKNIIAPSKSPWASPIVLVPKKDGSLRFCVDYRKVNEITHKDAYPIPRIDDTLDTLAGSMCFSTLDLKSGYWQVGVDPEHREKTAFCTHEGLFQFNVMPFGLCNAPATFQRLMDMVLSGLQWSSCIVYIDDIIVVGRTFDEHLNNLKQVFERIEKAGLKLHPSKCQFLQPKVQFLGHIVSTEGIMPDPSKTQQVKEWPVPTSVKEIQQFLGLASYYRRFIKGFASIASPLHKLTERQSRFQWTSLCQEAFDCLKSHLVSSPVLALPDWSQPFLLDTDASDTGIGAVLSQVQQGKECVIAYASRSLTKSERNYCVTRRELLAVVTFLQHFRPYLLGASFTIRMDHGALSWIHRFKEPVGQIARWLQKLQEFEFTFIHRHGIRHKNADAMSRIPCKQCGIIPADETIALATVSTPTVALLGEFSPEELRTAQLSDPDISLVLTSKEANQRPEIQPANDPGDKRLWQLWD